MKLAFILLLTLGTIHYVDNPIATMYAQAEQPYAAKAWEYILTNAGLCVVLALLGLLARKPVVWFPIGWGIIESGERSVCRLARPIGGEPPVVDLFTGLCGRPYYLVGLWAMVCLALYLRGKNERNT